MRTLAASGLGLIAAAALCAIGSIAHSAWSGVAWSAGAWLAAAATATAYRRIARNTGPALPAGALALLGVVASGRTVESTLRTVLPNDAVARANPLPVLALAGSGIALALLAWAVGRGGLVPAALAMLIAIAALLSTTTGDPGMPYLFGAGPLGVALLAAAIRARASTRGRGWSRSGAAADRGVTRRAGRAVGRVRAHTDL